MTEDNLKELIKMQKKEIRDYIKGRGTTKGYRYNGAWV